ncbi:fatty-acid--CoA ligase [Pueribacillus theae]|uniref:Fatty-acid--CoA ligase n=1 Tax=Pueribacillus theae TaxID=2171751 RepID=A0A2U1K7W9_9BACI|nr:long-chain fatty acid--CoA ligase [Pueribacillus theae]PWA12998.1 fatty-acid--CoA ligase [Pueribacillus theae]
MMNTQLTLNTLLERAEKYFPKKEIISRTHAGMNRFTYAQFGKRTRSLASALEKLGVIRGDKIGTLAWNDHRHLEAYFAIPSMGAVLHTINIRLSVEHLTYIIRNAEDKILLIDKDFVPLIEQIKDNIPSVKAFVIMTDEEQLPDTTLAPVYHYEAIVSEGDENYAFPADLNENEAAGMCYTSATTGNPKGVLYTHRSIVLHSITLGLADTLAISESDIAMPVVPMFHVNAWGMPFAGVWFGTTLVLPGPSFTPKILAELIDSEGVTVTAGVPTVWLGLAQELETGKYATSSLTRVICGGSAAPLGLIRTYEEKFNIPFLHAYGMTETSPIVTVSRLKSYQQDLSNEEKLEIRAKQGLLVPGVEAKIVNENGEVKADGEDMGELLLRGPWITDSYYKEPEKTAETVKDGWLHTGDIATIDEEGFIKLVDRTKDLVKSGGEWISSVDLENALMAHEAVFEAAVVAVPHPRWQERPVAAVVLKDTYKDSVSKEDILEYLEPQFAKWWLPDDVIFMEEIPKTSVGKFLKRELREQLKDHLTSASK